MRVMSFYYFGDELGMVNIRLNNIEDYNDVDTRNKYEGLKEKGGDLNVRIALKLREKTDAPNAME
jgi:oligo-1,6-glucosidase